MVKTANTKRNINYMYMYKLAELAELGLKRVHVSFSKRLSFRLRKFLKIIPHMGNRKCICRSGRVRHQYHTSLCHAQLKHRWHWMCVHQQERLNYDHFLCRRITKKQSIMSYDSLQKFSISFYITDWYTGEFKTFQYYVDSKSVERFWNTVICLY